MASINPAILQWARETAGLDLRDAAVRINLREARGVKGADRLAAFESGETTPDLPLLRRMAKQYRRPLLTFYLSQIPKPADVGEDFRNLPDVEATSDALLAALLRDIKSRQSLVRAILEDEDEATDLDFVGAITVNSSPSEAAETIADRIEFNREVFRSSSSVEEAFNYLRRCVEGSGVFVLLVGNLGSWQTAIDIETFRGFAVSDSVAPFIVINDQDAKSAWAFTLLHELTHVWLGLTGVSGGRDLSRVEMFCNNVAARLLIDESEIKELASEDKISTESVSAFANARHVSRSMVAYQLFLAGTLDEGAWKSMADSFRKEWLALRESQKRKSREQDGGPNYFVVKRHRIGPALLNLVRAGIGSGDLTPVRAAKILGVKPMSVFKLISEGARRGRVA